MPPAAYKKRSRLYKELCVVCGDFSSFKQYGEYICNACAVFFRRSVINNTLYTCKGHVAGVFVVDKAHRIQCSACRLDKCFKVGLKKNAVKAPRGPNRSTIVKKLFTSVCNNHNIPISNITQKGNARFEPGSNFFGLSNLSSTAEPYAANWNSYEWVTALSAIRNSLCERTARLLFMNIEWVLSLPSFVALPVSNKKHLLENTWCELLVIGYSQYLHHIDLNLFKTYAVSDDLKNAISIMQATVLEFQRLSPNPNEYTLIRSLVLFGPTSMNVLIRTRLSYGGSSQTNQRELKDNYLRSSQLLSLMYSAIKISNTMMAKLFFKAFLGDVPMESLIMDTYNKMTMGNTVV